MCIYAAECRPRQADVTRALGRPAKTQGRSGQERQSCRSSRLLCRIDTLEGTFFGGRISRHMIVACPCAPTHCVAGSRRADEDNNVVRASAPTNTSHGVRVVNAESIRWRL